MHVAAPVHWIEAPMASPVFAVGVQVSNKVLGVQELLCKGIVQMGARIVKGDVENTRRWRKNHCTAGLQCNKDGSGSGCVAQLVEQLLPIPEVRGSNPVIGNKLFKLNICLLPTVYRTDENKEKEAGNGPFFKQGWI